MLQCDPDPGAGAADRLLVRLRLPVPGHRLRDHLAVPDHVNTLFGLQSADRGMHDLFTLHTPAGSRGCASCMFPAALPAIFAGLRISAGLAVIGAIVGDFFFGQGEPGLGSLLNNYAPSCRANELFAAGSSSSPARLRRVPALRLALPARRSAAGTTTSRDARLSAPHHHRHHRPGRRDPMTFGRMLPPPRLALELSSPPARPDTGDAEVPPPPRETAARPATAARRGHPAGPTARRHGGGDDAARVAADDRPGRGGSRPRRRRARTRS